MAKADIETESKTVFVNVCFGEKNGHWFRPDAGHGHRNLRITRRPRFLNNTFKVESIWLVHQQIGE